MKYFIVAGLVLYSVEMIRILMRFDTEELKPDKKASLHIKPKE